MECCTSNTVCNRAITIGYLKSLIGNNIQNSTDGSTVYVNGNDDTYCPTYSELTGGTIIQNRVISPNASNDVDGIIVNSVCTETNIQYTANQVVNTEDLQVGWTRFISTSIQANPTSISECGGNSTLSYETTHRRALISIDVQCESSTTSSDTVSTSDGMTTFVISSSGKYGSISNSTYTIGKNGTISSDTRSDTISGKTEFRGTTYGSSNTSTITQNGLSGSYSTRVSTYQVTTSFTESHGTDTFETCDAISYTVTFNRQYDIWEVKKWVDSCGTDYPNKTISSKTQESDSEFVTAKTGNMNAVDCPYEHQVDTDTISHTYVDPICGTTFTTGVTFTRTCNQDCCSNPIYSIECPQSSQTQTNISACGYEGDLSGFTAYQKCTPTSERTISPTTYNIVPSQYNPTGLTLTSRSGGYLHFEVDENETFSQKNWVFYVEMTATNDPNHTSGVCSVFFFQNPSQYRFESPFEDSTTFSVEDCGGSGTTGEFYIARRCDSSQEWSRVPLSDTIYNITRISGPQDGCVASISNGIFTYTVGENCSSSAISWEYEITVEHATESSILAIYTITISQEEGPCVNCCSDPEFSGSCPQSSATQFNISACGGSGTLNGFTVKKRCNVEVGWQDVPTSYSVVCVNGVSSAMTIEINALGQLNFVAKPNTESISRSWTYDIIMSPQEDLSYSSTCEVSFTQLETEYMPNTPSSTLSPSVDSCGGNGSISNINVLERCSTSESWTVTDATYNASQLSQEGCNYTFENGVFTYSVGQNCSNDTKTFKYRLVVIPINDSAASTSFDVTITQTGPCADCCDDPQFKVDWPSVSPVNMDACGDSGTLNDFYVQKLCNVAVGWEAVTTVGTLQLLSGDSSLSLTYSSGQLQYSIDENKTLATREWTYRLTLSPSEKQSEQFTTNITFIQSEGFYDDSCPSVSSVTINSCSGSGTLDGFAIMAACETGGTWYVVPSTIEIDEISAKSYSSDCTYELSSGGVFTYSVTNNCTTSPRQWTYKIYLVANVNQSIQMECFITIIQEAGKCENCDCDCDELELTQIS